MRVLLTNRSLSDYGGTETWVYEMARKISVHHEVTIFSPELGNFADILKKVLPEVQVIDTPEASEPFDLAIVNHYPNLVLCRDLDCPVVYTSHGPSHILEQPIMGADHYVAVSEEVRAVGRSLGYKPHLIRNGVDMERFKPGEPEEMPWPHRKPRVLSMCKNTLGKGMVAAACYHQGIELDYAQWEENPTWDISPKIQWADIVVGYGRGCYEALSCNKAVLCFDARNREPRADGWLTKENISTMVTRNCSGRTNNLQWGVEDVEKALGQFRDDYMGWGREWVKAHHNIDSVVEQYLSFQQTTL